MDSASYETRGSVSPTCTLTFFDCLKIQSNEEDAHKRASRRIGVERQMRVLYDQPDLIEPMKLTLYDCLPTTPISSTPSQLTQLVSQGRNFASRASSRASTTIRRKTLSKSVISKPRPTMHTASDLPFRRRQEFTPLELSIYLPDKRLSDLPEFDRLSFTEVGTIKAPPRALLRTKSEEVLQTSNYKISDDFCRKPASMFEQPQSRRMSHVRKDTASSIISTSRPPSEHEALRSHPVSWCALPGLPPQIHMTSAPVNSVTILSPMQEEFTPPASAVMVGGTVLGFPDAHLRRLDTSPLTDQANLTETNAAAAPSPVVHKGPICATVAKTNEQTRQLEESDPRQFFHPNYQTQKRIDQWLSSRSRQSSISTIKTSSTTSSFAEHRRKRSEFYQLNKLHGQTKHQKPDTHPAVTVARPPTPLKIFRPFPFATAIQPAAPQAKPQDANTTHLFTHSRTTTSSTVATSLLFDPADADPDTNSATTYSQTDPSSRTGTVKSTHSSSRHAYTHDDQKKPVLKSVTHSPPTYTFYAAESTDLIYGHAHAHSLSTDHRICPDGLGIETYRGDVGVAF